MKVREIAFYKPSAPSSFGAAFRRLLGDPPLALVSETSGHEHGGEMSNSLGNIEGDVIKELGGRHEALLEGVRSAPVSLSGAGEEIGDQRNVRFLRIDGGRDQLVDEQMSVLRRKSAEVCFRLAEVAYIEEFLAILFDARLGTGLRHR